MEEAIINITNLLPYEIFKNNRDTIKLINYNINKIKINKEWIDIITKEKKYKDLIEKISHDEGNSLTIKDFITHKNGSFSLNTSNLEDSILSEYVTLWKNENCIGCNKWADVCPQGIIVTGVLSEEELKNNKVVIVTYLLDKEGYKFALEKNHDKCTGCEVFFNI